MTLEGLDDDGLLACWLAQRAPDSVIVLNNLAQTLSDLGRNEEALPFIERAAAAGGPFASAVQQTRRTVIERISARK
ncbi:MAG TPA: tetratricopeptide repeat protein [Burkholderiales bacterium]|nr:tetratricopeptide repeat protein [Burkholderiales bacterium]